MKTTFTFLLLAAALRLSAAGLDGWTFGPAEIANRLPWSPLVDVRFAATAPDGGATAVRFGLTATNGAQTFDIPPAELTRAADGADGRVHLVWNPVATHAGRVFSALSVVPYAVENLPYLDVDLETGAVTERPAAFADEVNQDLYKTTHLVLKRVSCTLGADWTAAKGRTWFRSTRADGAGDVIEDNRVTLTRDYWIGVFEVTQKQYETVTGENPSFFTAGGETTRPVENVSYNDIRGLTDDDTTVAIAWPTTGRAVQSTSFLGKLRARTGLAFDLPTNAQWEYACRAGEEAAKTGPIAGNTSVLRGWQNGFQTTNVPSAEGGTCPVGSYAPNPWGFYDMQGNVAEYTLDYFSRVVQKAALTDPVGPSSGLTSRTCRGGSWYNYASNGNPTWARAGAPDNKTPEGAAVHNVGFRLCLN